MVNTATQQLNQVFGGALSEAGFRSWTGPQGASTQWLDSHLGDVYLHETAISHIRRLLREKFVCLRVGETSPQSRQRMKKVQDYMNSEEFAREPDGRGLAGSAKGAHGASSCWAGRVGDCRTEHVCFCACF